MVAVAIITMTFSKEVYERLTGLEQAFSPTPTRVAAPAG